MKHRCFVEDNITAVIMCRVTDPCFAWSEKSSMRQRPPVAALEHRLYHSRRVLMEAQILRAGPSLMFIVDMRWSSRRSSRACPSISCDRNWAASSSQPEDNKTRIQDTGTLHKYKMTSRQTADHQPWSDEMNLQTSSTLHWAGVDERKLAPSGGRLPGAELSDRGALCSALEHECEELGESEGESSSLDTSSERLDSEWHCMKANRSQRLSETLYLVL